MVEVVQGEGGGVSGAFVQKWLDALVCDPTLYAMLLEHQAVGALQPIKQPASRARKRAKRRSRDKE
jgi:hypothetical protein